MAGPFAAVQFSDTTVNDDSFQSLDEAIAIFDGIGNRALFTGVYAQLAQMQLFSGQVDLAHEPFAGVPLENLEIVKGEDLISTFQKSPDSELAFCSQCGSTLFGKRSDRGLYHLRTGILDDEPTQHPTGRIYLGSGAKWYDLDGDLNRHEVRPDGPDKL